MNRQTRPQLWRLGAGGRTTAIGNQVATMVDVADRSLAERLWAAQHESGADGALELLLQGGIVAVPDFVLIEVEGDVYRLVVRGKAKVVVYGDDGSVSYEGANVRLAAEHLITAPTAVQAGFVDTLPGTALPSRLDIATDDAVGGGAAGAESGMVSGFGLFDWMAVLGGGHEAAPPTTAPGTEYALPQPSPLPSPSTPSGDAMTDLGFHPAAENVSAEGEAAPTDPVDADPTEVARAASRDEALGSNDDQTRSGDRDDGDLAERPHPAVNDGPDRASELTASDDVDTGIIADDVGVADTGGRDAVAVDGDEPDDDGQRYASIFGATIQRSVIDAAVRHPTEADGEAAADGADGQMIDPPAPSIAPGSDPAGDAPANQISVDTMPPGGERVHDHTLPPYSEERETGAVAAVAGLGDHDGHTISRADLPAIDSAGGAATQPGADVDASEFAGPHVQSVRCAEGHDNPPYRSECGRCQLPLDAEPVSIPRPPVGTLTFSTGDEVILDRPVLVGRKPDIAGLTCNEIPREVAIDVGDGLSRSHALFSIGGWQVRVEDLGSTNHTTIRLPNQPAQRLRVGEPVPITDGTVIDLGGEVTCRYDFNI